jgi:hypothetical protein
VRLAAALSDGKHRSQAGLDLDAIESKLQEFVDELGVEHASAQEVWTQIRDEVAIERRRLAEQGDFAAVEALKVLDAQFAETTRIVGAVGGSLVSEDLIVIDDMLRRGKDDKYERRVIRLAWAAQLAGREERARKLAHVYLLLNVRRRLLVNTLYYTAVEAGKLTLPTDRETLKKIGIGTVGESLQDLVLAVPFLDTPVVKDGVESLRKYLAKEVEGIVTR